VSSLGFEPTTLWLRVRHPNHSATALHCLLVESNIFTIDLWNFKIFGWIPKSLSIEKVWETGEGTVEQRTTIIVVLLEANLLSGVRMCENNVMAISTGLIML
jgi:hypothetical protein